MATFNTTVKLHDPALREALDERAARLEARILQIGLGAPINWPEGTAADTARYYLQKLQARDPETATEVLTVLVDESESLTDQFWGTTLGRTLFALGAWPDGDMSRATAMHILGLKSRQRVHQLIVEGLVEETMGGLITSASVRALMTVA
jgi:hypothetical protein